MFRIMVVKDKRDNYGSLYQYLTTTVDGVIQPLEYAGTADIDAKVETMLNTDGYSKDDFIIVQVSDYTITTNLYEQTE